MAWHCWPELVPTGAPLSPPQFHHSPLAPCRFFTPKVEKLGEKGFSWKSSGFAPLRVPAREAPGAG